MNVDRYITQGVLDEMGRDITHDDVAREVLHEVLPGILAQHRADVLREAAGVVDDMRRTSREIVGVGAGAALVVAANLLLRLADDARG